MAPKLVFGHSVHPTWEMMPEAAQLRSRLCGACRPDGPRCSLSVEIRQGLEQERPQLFEECQGRLALWIRCQPA